MKRGFTLLELIIVIIILGILALVAFPRYIATLETARQSEALATMSAVREAEQAYFATAGSYTDTFPIGVDIDGVTGDEIYIAQPVSANFAYTVPSVDASAGYIQAKSIAGAGRKSYGMCLASNKTKTDCAAAADCNPTCP